jgi:hypothetical protein
VRAAALPVVLSPSLRAEYGAQHVTQQLARLDDLAIARGDAFVIERRARERLVHVRSLGHDDPVRKTCWPAASSRNDARRYWLPPRIAPMKWPIRPRATSGLYSTGAFIVASLRAPRRRTARSPL